MIILYEATSPVGLENELLFPSSSSTFQEAKYKTFAYVDLQNI